MPFSELYLKPLLAGATFGTALTSAGVYNPSVIIGQMKFKDLLMLKVFLTATATSAAVIPFAKYFGFSQVSPRASSSIGLFSRYDANILGGALLGIGMALTGACPGTVLPQIATGVKSSLLVALGGISGAMLCERYVSVTQGASSTLNEQLDVETKWAVPAYQFLCMAVVAAAAHFAPGDKYLVSPLIGGVLIGGSQAVNLLLTGNGLGVSSAYGSIEYYLKSVFSVKAKHSETKRDYRSVIFVFGALLGSWVLNFFAHLPLAPKVEISAARALIGGALLLFGARLGGGCTSGHGITGMSQLSISSFITVAAMFGGGMAWSFLFD